ncbi:MAG: DUF3772 domain-containing protein [Pseudomonadota bacterium]
MRHLAQLLPTVFAAAFLSFAAPDLVSAEEAFVEESAPLPQKVLREVTRISKKIGREDDQREWASRVEEWEKTLSAAEKYIGSEEYTGTDSSRYYRQVTEVASNALESQEAVETQLLEQQNLLETLGPVPREDEIQEADEIAEKRALYLAQVSQSEARQTQIQLTLKRAEGLAEHLSSLRRELLVDRLQIRSPYPLAPQTLTTAIPEFFSQTAAVGSTVLQWLESITALLEKRESYALWILLAGVAVVFLLFMRRWIMARYGRDPAIEHPSYSRRTIAALAEVFAKGGVPIVILVAAYEGVQLSEATIDKALSVPVEAALASIAIFILLASFVGAAFAPRRPAWRLVRLSEQGSYVAGSILILLIAVFATDAFFQRAFENNGVGDELQALLAFSFLAAESIGLLLLTPQRWWRIVDHDETSTSTLRNPATVWNVLRYSVAILSIVAIVSSAVGYIEFGDYVLESMTKTIVIVALMFSLRAIMYETVGALVQTSLLRKKLELRIITLQRIKFWINAAVTPGLLLFGGFFVVRVWGVPEEDLYRWAQVAVTGFSVGSITISLVDILSALALFIIGMLATRALQGVVLKHVMPQVTENVGMHHSIAAGVGYLGLIIALMIGVAALGIDLSNVALIAGALSVGIGFGLQNIVSNFVSGIILIFEQPIKVDDWVIVNGQEGMVKRINFRATELETFDRASVLIPNADLLANPVTNRTLKDKYGRIEVGISVAYGSDTKQVEALLLECAANQQHVMKNPAPFVLFQNFGADGLDFEVRCYTSDVTYKAIIASAIRFSIDNAFREAGIEIPFPQRVVHLAGGGAPPPLSEG